MPNRTPSALRAAIAVVSIALTAAVLTATPASAAKGTAGGAKGAAKQATQSAKARQAARARSIKGPDLVARSLSLDFLAEGFSVEAKLANVGSRTARASQVTVAISTDTALSREDDVLQAIPVPAVQAGVERRIAAEVAIPDALPEGDLYLLVCADGGRTVRERDESNNCAAQLVASADDAPELDETVDESDEDATGWPETP